MNAAELRKLVLSWPGTSETLQWGNNRVFKVGSKMFAVSGYEPDSLYSFIVGAERFLELSDLPGFKPAPYFARLKWVQVDEENTELPPGALEELLHDAYAIVFARLTKKLQREIRPES
ncbi:MAG: MmcQ/YjbR family DNA-binding protein [Pseudomonadota bacterium]